MGRYSKNKKRIAFKKYIALGLIAVALVPGVFSTAFFYRQFCLSFGKVGTQAAVFSALYNVPNKTLEHLQRRFSGEISDPDVEKENLPFQDTPRTEPDIFTPNSGEIISEHPISPTPDISNDKSPEPVPEEYRGEIIEEDMSASPHSDYPSLGAGVIKNTTFLSDTAVQAIMEDPEPIQIETDGPQVLIMHTHATESFEPYDSDFYDTRHTWRSTDNSQNIVAAGEVMADAIRAHGIEVLHDQTQHDYPSYNGSYERSAATVQEYLKKYPSIKVVLDVHRDAVQRENTLVKPITKINGKKAAQLMIIAGCDDGTMGMPNWQKNLRFAAGIQNAIESRFPGLTRPVFFCYRKYNQDLTTGSLLLEMGSHGNTLDEVLYSSALAGDAIGTYLDSLSVAS